MHSRAGQRGALVVIAAPFVVFSMWLVIGEHERGRPTGDHYSLTRHAPDGVFHGSTESIDVADLVAIPDLSTVGIDSQSLDFWALPGAIAALITVLVLLERQIGTRRIELRFIVHSRASGRAPPPRFFA